MPGKARYLQAAPGGYAEGDEFIGSTVPQGRQVARRYRHDVTDADLVALLGSRWHEERQVALELVCEVFERADGRRRERMVRLVLAHRERIDNWDLVDSWAPNAFGRWLREPGRADERRHVLDALAASPSVWDRRTAVVGTFASIRAGDFGETLRLAEQVLDDEHHLVHKAVGWMLREVGNRDVDVLRGFIDEHGARMPRVTLRYAVERLDPAERAAYLQITRRTARGYPNAVSEPRAVSEPTVQPEPLDVVLLLSEQALGEDDARRIAELHEGEDLEYKVLVPADTQRNLLVDVLDHLSLFELRKALRELRSDHDDEKARASATEALDASLAALQSRGMIVSGEITGDDPLPALVAAVSRYGAREVIVITRPHAVEDTFHTDWASRARDELGVPVLHVYAGTTFLG